MKKSKKNQNKIKKEIIDTIFPFNKKCEDMIEKTMNQFLEDNYNISDITRIKNFIDTVISYNRQFRDNPIILAETIKNMPQEKMQALSNLCKILGVTTKAEDIRERIRKAMGKD